MKRGTNPTVPFMFDVKLATRLAAKKRVQDAMEKVRAAGWRPRHTVDLTDFKLSVIERKFVFQFAHVPADADIPAYIEAWLRHQQRFGQPRLRDYVRDLAVMLGQPEVLHMLGDWTYPPVRSGPKPAHSGSKAVMLTMAANGKSSHLDDSFDDVTSSPGRRDTLAWALELGAHMVERDEPEFRIVDTTEGLYRHVSTLAETLGRRAMKANVRMLRSLAALYPNLPICEVAGIDGTAVAAWIEQRKHKSPDDEAELRSRASHAGFRSYNRKHGKKGDVGEGETCDIQKGGKFWRGYFLVALVDYCTGRPIVWTLIDASTDEAKALHELLRLLFEFWPKCPLKTIVGDGAWDEDWAHELCETCYGIHLVASRGDERRLDAKHPIEKESHPVAYYDGRGQAYCRKHGLPLTRFGSEFAQRHELGLAAGDQAPPAKFRARFKCHAKDEYGEDDSCGTTSLQVREHWSALSYYPHTPYSQPKAYAERFALLDHRNVCESAFNALKVGRGLATAGADRLRLNDFDSVHALIDLSFCMATALLLGQERDRLGIAYATPTCEGDRPEVVAA